MPDGKSAMRQLAELWVVRPFREIASQIGLELRAAPASIGHEFITKGWFGREMEASGREFSSIHGKSEPEKDGPGVHGPSLNETGVHGRDQARVETAVGIHGPQQEESRDLFGLTRDERITIADTRETLTGLGNERAVGQLDLAFEQHIGIVDRDDNDWSLYDSLMRGDHAPEPDQDRGREPEVER